MLRKSRRLLKKPTKTKAVDFSKKNEKNRPGGYFLLDFFPLICVMHNFNEKIIKPYADCGMDSLLVRNSIFYNGAKEGIVVYSGSSGDPAVRFKYAENVVLQNNV